MKRYIGRATGAVIGLAGGPPGVAFGFFVGWLVDEVRVHHEREEIVDRFLRNPDEFRGRRSRPDLATLALMVLVASADGSPGTSFVDQIMRDYHALYAKTRTKTPYLIRVVAERVHVSALEALARYLGGILTEPELVRHASALVAAAAGNETGITTEQRELLRAIVAYWPVDTAQMSEFERSTEGLNRQALRVLGLSATVEEDQLRSVYRSLVKTIHPDTASPLDAGKQAQLADSFRRCREAYETLSGQLHDRRRVWGDKST